MENTTFLVQPFSTWTTHQILFWPFLFIIPAEILGWFTDLVVYCSKISLPPEKRYVITMKGYVYITFNRLVLMPFLMLWFVRLSWNSRAVVWGSADALNVFNTLVAFVVVFSLSDLVYYTGHRIVHGNLFLYTLIHKFHHQDSTPTRGWIDSCNATPFDFFYTGVSTMPISTLWLMPDGLTFRE